MNFSIPEPCPVKWDSMQARGNGKYCGACDKVVVDFAYKTNEEIVSYLRSEKGKNCCGNFLTEQLKPKSTFPQPVQNKKNIRIFLAALYFVFGGFLFLSTPANAQVFAQRPEHRTGGAVFQDAVDTTSSYDLPVQGVQNISSDTGISTERKIEHEEYIDEMCKKYPQGLTEIKEVDRDDSITKKIIIAGRKIEIYSRHKYPWGVFYFKDDMQISEATYNQEPSPAHVKELLDEYEVIKKQQQAYVDSLCKKYPQGITETIELEPNDTLTKRIVVVGNQAWIYTRRKYKLVGFHTYYWKDNRPIWASTFYTETSPAYIEELKKEKK
jgi:hypothetical protein